MHARALGCLLVLAGCAAEVPPIDDTDGGSMLQIPEMADLDLRVVHPTSVPSDGLRGLVGVAGISVEVIERRAAGATHRATSGADGHVHFADVIWEGGVDVHVNAASHYTRTLAALTLEHVSRLRREGWEVDGAIVIEVPQVLEDLRVYMDGVPPQSTAIIVSGGGDSQTIEPGRYTELLVRDARDTQVTALAVHRDADGWTVDAMARARGASGAGEMRVDFASSPELITLSGSFELPAGELFDGLEPTILFLDDDGLAGLVHEVVVDDGSVTFEGVGFPGLEHQAYIYTERSGRYSFDTVPIGVDGLAYDPALAEPAEYTAPLWDGVAGPGDQVLWDCDDEAWLHRIDIQSEEGGARWSILTLSERGLVLPEVPEGLAVPPGYLGIESCAQLGHVAQGWRCLSGSIGSLRTFTP